MPLDGQTSHPIASPPQSGPASKRRAFPVLECVSQLAPDANLIDHVNSPSFELHDFTNGARAPQALVDALATQGYEIDEDVPDWGMLFASEHGVTLHADEKPAALWVLQDLKVDHLELIVGGEHATLKAGGLYLFDARKMHGVICAAHGRWAVFSCYVRRTTSRGSRQNQGTA